MDGEPATIERDGAIRSGHKGSHMTAPMQRIEVITRSERRRRWSIEEKREIVAESLGSGVRPSEIIQRHGITSGQLYAWRQQLTRRVDGQPVRPVAKFARVDVVAAEQASPVRSKGQSSSTVVLAEPKKETGLRCFAIMPFKEHDSTRSKGFFDEVLRALIAPSGRDAGFEVVTANRDGSDVIQATIVNQLLDADLVIADLTENNPNVLFELGLRIAEDKPVALIRAKGTPAIFDVDNMLRVFEYDSNLWTSTIEHDRAKLQEHIRGSWENRDSALTFMKILRERKSSPS